MIDVTFVNKIREEKAAFFLMKYMFRFSSNMNDVLRSTISLI